MGGGVAWWMWIVGFAAVLGPLVTIHEFGHYLVGRMFGVKADAFSVGFGKEIAGYTDARGTRWKLSALPLGGYVQFKGDMNPASAPSRDQGEAALPFDGSFNRAALWKRAAIVAAGPITNLLVTVLIFAAFFVSFGKPVIETRVSSFAENSAARDAGLRQGDLITAIDGTPVGDFREVQNKILMFPGETVELQVDRDGSDQVIPVRIASETVTDRFGNESRIGRIGVAAEGRSFEPVGPLQAVGYGVSESIELLDMMVTGIKQIVVGDRSVRELGGPLKIAKYSGEQLSLGPLAYVSFIALISLNLAFINLLPIPALDGGHLAFYAAEAVRGKPVGARGQEYAFRAGMAFGSDADGVRHDKRCRIAAGIQRIAVARSRGRQDYQANGDEINAMRRLGWRAA